MTINFYDIARMTSSSIGDSDIILDAAVPGCKTFQQAGVSDSYEINYGIVTYDAATHRPVGSEVGVGIVTVDSDEVYRLTNRTAGVLSSVLSSDSQLDVPINLTGLSEIYIPFLSKDVLRVKEIDGDPSVYPVNTIVVTNGTLSQDSIEGQVSITTGGGSGGGLSGEWWYGASVDSVPNTSSASLLPTSPTLYEHFGDSGLVHWDSDTFNLVWDIPGFYEINYDVFIQPTVGGNLGLGYVRMNGAFDNFYISCDSAMPAVSVSVTEYYEAGINDVMPMSFENQTGTTVSGLLVLVAITKLHDP